MDAELLKYALPAAIAFAVLIVRAFRRATRKLGLGVLVVSLAWAAQASLGIAEPRGALTAFLSGFFWAAVIAHAASLIFERTYGKRT